MATFADRTTTNNTNECPDLDIRVEAFRCFSNFSSLERFLNIQEGSQNPASETLNTNFLDLSAISSIPAPFAMASNDLSINLQVFMSKIDTKNFSPSFQILKIDYKSPCDLSALSFRLDGPELGQYFMISPIGIIRSEEEEFTSTAYGKMVSFTPLLVGSGFEAGLENKNLVALNLPEYCFSHQSTNTGGVLPASEDYSTFCYFLVAFSGSCAPDGFVYSSTNSNVKGFRDEYVPMAESYKQGLEQAIADGSASNPEKSESEILAGQMFFRLGALLSGLSIYEFAYMLAPDNPQVRDVYQFILNLSDFDADGDINAGDIHAGFKLLFLIGKPEFSMDAIPNIVPIPCCTEDEPVIVIPDPVIPEARPVNCSSSIEILNVFCGNVNINKKASAGGAGSSSMTFGLGESESTTNIAVESTVSSECDESADGLQQNNVMIIDIGLRTNVSCSGIQFDIGFNKFSSAARDSITVQSPSNFESAGWRSIYETFNDRYGYDKLVRYALYQAIESQHTLIFDLDNEEQVAAAHKFRSIPATNNLHFARIIIADAPSTTCACPKKKYYIASVPHNKNEEIVLDPELYQVGAEWTGPVIYEDGVWWTAKSVSNGVVRDEYSVPLNVKWEGISILNERVVTNEDLYQTQHTKYELKYFGIYPSLLPVFGDDDSFQDLPNLYANIFKQYETKLLYNGLDFGMSEHMSKYTYNWEKSYETLIEYLETINESPVSDDKKQELIDSFTAKKGLAGYADDANLDGKFDVADIVALYNFARVRQNLAKQASVAKTLDWNYTPVSLPSTPYYLEIVPSYCLDNICTSTKSEICPDICGSVGSETRQTVKNRNNRFSSAFTFGQRTDIFPSREATLELVFKSTPEEKSWIKLVNVAGKTKTYQFVTTDQTGDLLSGGSVAINISSGASTEFCNYLMSDDEMGFGCILNTTVITNDSITIIQSGDGRVGNKNVEYGGNLISSLSRYQTSFSGGTNAITTLPDTFRGWDDYFYNIHNIRVADLYQGEMGYKQWGASHIPIEMRMSTVKSSNVGFVHWSAVTLDFCDTFYDNDSFNRLVTLPNPLVKVLPSDGFKYCEVYDAKDGDLMSPIETNPAAEFYNFYEIPSHRKITIVSHNFKAQGAFYENRADFEESASELYAPITTDGGKLTIAHTFVYPMPAWKNGRTVKIVNGHNSIAGGEYCEFGLSAKPFNPLTDESANIVPVGSKDILVGPPSSQLTQRYPEDSASLVVDADYVLHTKILSPRSVVISYNALKPFRYISFTIAAKNSAEIVSLIPANTIHGELEGWNFEHHFHENKTSADGLPLNPNKYGSDGYSVVTISPSGMMLGQDGNTYYGISNPLEFSGSGDLCIITFNEDVFDSPMLFGKSYICPPLGSATTKFKDKPVYTVGPYEYKSIDDKFPLSDGFYSSYNLSSSSNDVVRGEILANYDSSNNQNGKMDLTNSGSNLFVDKISSMLNGSLVLPHNNDDSHRPTWSVGDGDVRHSLEFGTNRTFGLSDESGIFDANLTKFSAYCSFDGTLFEDELQNTATIFVAGGDGVNSPSVKLDVTRHTPSSFHLNATISAENSPVVIQADLPASEFSGWNIVGFIVDFAKKTAYLYLNGEKVASDTSLTYDRDNSSYSPFFFFLGHNGTADSINGSSGDAFVGRIGQVIIYNDAHTDGMRKNVESYLSMKYSTQNKLPTTHPAYIDEQNSTGVAGMNESTYLTLNKVDIRNIKATKKFYNKTEIDLDSDRCGAYFVSRHICLDKNGQTLIHKKCKPQTDNRDGGTGIIESGGGGSFTISQ